MNSKDKKLMPSQPRRPAPQPPSISGHSPTYTLPPCTPSTWAAPHQKHYEQWAVQAAKEANKASYVNRSKKKNAINKDMSVIKIDFIPTQNNHVVQQHGKPRKVLDVSQGSCDTTPATPDSLAASSLACSAEEEDHLLMQTDFSAPRGNNTSQLYLPQPLTPTTSLVTPSLSSSSPLSSVNQLGCDMRANGFHPPASPFSTVTQCDNLIEEVTTPVPILTTPTLNPDLTFLRSSPVPNAPFLKSNCSSNASSPDPSSSTSSCLGLASGSSDCELTPPRERKAKRKKDFNSKKYRNLGGSTSNNSTCFECPSNEEPYFNVSRPDETLKRKSSSQQKVYMPLYPETQISNRNNNATNNYTLGKNNKRYSNNFGLESASTVTASNARYQVVPNHFATIQRIPLKRTPGTEEKVFNTQRFNISAENLDTSKNQTHFSNQTVHQLSKSEADGNEKGRPLFHLSHFMSNSFTDQNSKTSSKSKEGNLEEENQSKTCEGKSLGIGKKVPFTVEGAFKAFNEKKKLSFKKLSRQKMEKCKVPKEEVYDNIPNRHSDAHAITSALISSDTQLNFENPQNGNSCQNMTVEDAGGREENNVNNNKHQQNNNPLKRLNSLHTYIRKSVKRRSKDPEDGLSLEQERKDGEDGAIAEGDIQHLEKSPQILSSRALLKKCELDINKGSSDFQSDLKSKKHPSSRQSEEETFKSKPDSKSHHDNNLTNNNNNRKNTEASSSKRGNLEGNADKMDQIQVVEDEEESFMDQHDMEYCDPCYCYGKCCMDVVASIFCVSLL